MDRCGCRVAELMQLHDCRALTVVRGQREGESRCCAWAMDISTTRAIFLWRYSLGTPASKPLHQSQTNQAENPITRMPGQLGTIAWQDGAQEKKKYPVVRRLTNWYDSRLHPKPLYTLPLLAVLHASSISSFHTLRTLTHTNRAADPNTNPVTWTCLGQ